MYIIRSGQFAVTKTKGNSEVVLAEISTGAMVGEMAIFDKKPRSANVKAIKDSEVIMLPYEALHQQLDGLPVWIKAILRTLNENLREANKKIKILENPNTDEDRYPPHVINKLLSILSFVGLKYGTKEGDGLLIPTNRLRNYTIQVFQEATNKMDSIQNALKEMGYYQVEDLGEGKKKLVNLKPDLIFDFVDWYNEYLYKQDKDKIPMSEQDTKIALGLLHFAKKVEPVKGLNKVNLTEVQNESMKELGFMIKIDEVGGLVEKKVVTEKMQEENSTFVNMNLAEVEKPLNFWKFFWDLKKHLK